MPLCFFEGCYNRELHNLTTIMRTYPVLTATQLDEDGKPYPMRVTGLDVVPSHEADSVLGYAACQVWHMTPTEFASLPAHEFLRRVALHRASEWSQPTRATIELNKRKARL